MTNSDVEVVYLPLRAGLAGFYHHPSRTIAINSDTPAACQRVTLVHETIHAERGDSKCSDPWFDTKQELTVERETARRLVTVDDLVTALMECLNHDEVAEYLEVDKRLLQVRVQLITCTESEYINKQLDKLEQTA